VGGSGQSITGGNSQTILKAKKSDFLKKSLDGMGISALQHYSS
jgi:hypothetical protein